MDAFSTMMDSVLLEQQHWLARWIFVWIAMLGAAACTYYARKAPPGFLRLLATLPALVVMHLCPLLFNFQLEPVAATSATFLCVRLTSGKVVAFILGRGALTLPLSFIQFVAVMLAPFMPAEIAADRVVVVVSTPQPSASSSRDNNSSSAAARLEPSMDAAAFISSIKSKGLHPLHTMWQRVSPAQRFSIDSTTNTSRSSSTGTLDRTSSSASSLDSPRIAAVRQQSQEGVDADESSSTLDTTTSLHLQQQQQGGDDGAAPAGQTTDSSPKAAITKAGAHSSHPRTTSNSNSNSHSNSNRLLPMSASKLLLNAAVSLAFIVYCCHSTAALRGVIYHLGAMALMWRSMELLMLSVSCPARTWLGMTLAPHFINPFAATSLTDFWARRWNITQGLVLRFYVYEPIIEGRLVAPPAAPPATPAPTAQLSNGASHSSSNTRKQPAAGAAVSPFKPPSGKKHPNSLKLRKPSPLSGARNTTSSTTTTTTTATVTLPDTTAAARAASQDKLLAGPSSSTAVAPRWRRQLAAAATFVVSGLEHELFLWYLLRPHWDTQWMVFFSLQGLLLAGEGRIKRAARAAGLQLHPFVSHLAVLLVLGLTADAFFWPPLVQPRMVEPLAASAAAALPDVVIGSSSLLGLVQQQ